MKTVNRINNGWLFCGVPYGSEVCSQKAVEVNIPHTVQAEPINYFDENNYQHHSYYVKHMKLESVPERSFLCFDGVMAYAEVFVNGTKVGAHKGGYTAFEFETTSYLKQGANEIIVAIDSSERSCIPPFGYAIDYITYGGIYRDVWFKTADNACINGVKIDTSDCLGAHVQLTAMISLNAVVQEKGALTVTLHDKGAVAQKTVEVALKPGDNSFNVVLGNLDGITLWDTECPKLYNCEITYTSERSTSEYGARVGFRKAEFTNKGFFLNGKKVKIFGLNRHQDFPVVGYAATKRVQEKDADILKNDLSLNLVRASHYPQSRYFLDRCDEIGLMVFEEIPGWQHIGDQEWQDVAVENVREMINHDYNHPSIVLWGVRINESDDCHDFYLRTNELAHKLDNTRQTGGVRCCLGSELLEDVYTFNDFVFTGANEPCRTQQQVTGLKENVPYLITEFNGHMYPTKSYDQEERCIEHARRFAEIYNQAWGKDDISGAIGWCAFDYHTHSNFGSGDHICYHGVMDQFRFPKMAAYFFKSQKSPEKEPVLEAATRWTVGDRNGGGIAPVTVYTNCEYVDVIVKDKNIGRFYPEYEKFPNLSHPPLIIEQIRVAWGEAWGDGRLEGYVGGKRVITREYTACPVPTKLMLIPDSAVLTADGTDMTRIGVQVVDQKGNILAFLFTPLTIKVTGGAELIGDPVVSTQGGVYAFFVKSNGKKEDVVISVSSYVCGENDCRVTVE